MTQPTPAAEALRVAVVMPAYNEAGHIGAVLAGIPPRVAAVFVVDDCSTDDTRAVAEACPDPRVTVLSTPENQGVGGATVTGYRAALAAGADVAVKVDADGQMDLGRLDELLAPFADPAVDYCKGNRFVAGRSLEGMPPARIFGNICLTFLTKLASGYWHVFDPQNGYTAVRARALARLDLGGLHRGYFFENDMLCQLGRDRAVVRDVPLPARYGDEVSHLSIRKVLAQFPRLLVDRTLRRLLHQYVLADFSPIALFLGAGALLFGGGAALGAAIWVAALASGRPTNTGTIMLALLPLIIGFQLLLQGLVLDIQESRR